LLWLQIRPSPSFKWVPKAEPIGVGALIHTCSVVRGQISRKLFLCEDEQPADSRDRKTYLQHKSD
jgi:hypothetical protein